MALKNGRTTTSLQTVIIGSVIPTGTIAPFGGGSVPEGWLLCDGSTISRTTYSALFGVVSTLHGEGDATTTFHLPDYRGRFLRGADAAAGRDPDRATRTAANAGGATGNNVGTVQGEQTKAHAHTMNKSSSGSGADSGGSGIGSGTFAAIYTSHPTGGNETRPQNANVNYIIKV